MGMALTIPRYTVDDLEQFPDDGNRYELLDGVLIVTPSPRPAHQIVVGELHRLFHRWVSNGLARVVGPGAITRPPGTQLEPDLLVFPSRFSAMKSWVEITEHWLAVEVLSRSSRFYDREFKRDAYFALGVPQVWLVDVDDRSIDVWRSRSEHEIVRNVIRWRVPTLDLVVPIDLAELFAGLD
jgi:Uma2 family endonuclease